MKYIMRIFKIFLRILKVIIILIVGLMNVSFFCTFAGLPIILLLMYALPRCMLYYIITGDTIQISNYSPKIAADYLDSIENICSFISELPDKIIPNRIIL